jgi:hypothetical protein
MITGVLPHQEQAIFVMLRYHLYSILQLCTDMPFDMKMSGVSSHPSTGWSDTSLNREMACGPFRSSSMLSHPRRSGAPEGALLDAGSLAALLSPSLRLQV